MFGVIVFVVGFVVLLGYLIGWRIVPGAQLALRGSLRSTTAGADRMPPSRRCDLVGDSALAAFAASFIVAALGILMLPSPTPAWFAQAVRVLLVAFAALCAVAKLAARVAERREIGDDNQRRRALGQTERRNYWPPVIVGILGGCLTFLLYLAVVLGGTTTLVYLSDKGVITPNAQQIKASATGLLAAAGAVFVVGGLWTWWRVCLQRRRILEEQRRLDEDDRRYLRDEDEGDVDGGLP